ncbi:DgyrCDS10753 [Dimorphilus gyrociliatus]|uniref:DgyrCDS10753 n=1 Tax=Dimorphilus gyrociliatus TaxID=2664684 RepID=A0A7I8W1A4_9ANNE|nr:DgyrCDS10753 [Dimorphilus gyrociliatus]
MLKNLLLLAFISCVFCKEYYTVVFDAGSSGTRVYIYKIKQRINLLPEIKLVINHKETPGIDDKNIEDVESYLESFTRIIKDNVPDNFKKFTKIHFLATAGMRLSKKTEAHRKLDRVRKVLRNLKPFPYDKSNVRIMSGEEEGAYTWVATNYLTKQLENANKSQTIGIVEMGGASSQIAFLKEGNILANFFQAQIGLKQFPLYSHSYLHYGKDKALEWIRSYLMRKHKKGIIEDPCMVEGTDDGKEFRVANRTFKAKPNYEECVRLINYFIYEAPDDRCYPTPCAIGTTYQPKPDENMKFYTLATFFWSLKNLKLHDQRENVKDYDQATFTIENVKQKIRKYFNDSDPFKELERNPKFPLRKELFSSLYAIELLTDGLNFKEDRVFTAVSKIGDHSIDWTLGLALRLADFKICDQKSTQIHLLKQGGTLIFPSVGLLLICLITAYAFTKNTLL